MNPIIEVISKIGIVPVVALDDVKDAEPLAAALCGGGIPCAEITFRTAAAEDSIRRMTEAFPEMLVGAGTVLTTQQADRALSAGAKFIVSPGFNPKVVSHCLEKKVPILPGISNPSDVEAAIEMGLEAAKFFPAEQAGGLAMLKAMSAPYRQMKFMPTGGINEENLKEYLAFDRVIACGGSWMVKKDLVAAGRFDEIERLSRRAVTKMLGFELRHVGINETDEKAAAKTAKVFAGILGMAEKEGEGSIFVGDAVEVLKKPYLGTHGHIAVAVNNMERAIYYLERQHVAFAYDTLCKDEKGRIKTVYLAEEAGGFAVHLLQK